MLISKSFSVDTFLHHMNRSIPYVQTFWLLPCSFGLVKSYDMSFIVESASLEPKSGSKFIAGGEDMWVHVFDFLTGEEITCNKGHHGPVHCVRFAPGGESYASGSEDGTIRIWQLSPPNVDAEEAVDTNGKPKAGAEEIACKIEGFHIAKEEKAGE
uniref:Serine-threonine kinase receptor-associated protein n=1 Tax=Aegilops tauschii subsp. strangulata TaxID=200361 RepID=A0A453KQJ9_AEGTS